MKIFLAFAFRDDDRDVVRYVERTLAAHYVPIITGERLGGEQLTPAVQSRIDQCNALVALLTRRDQLQNNSWTTHQWVLDELGYARTKHKKVIALVEEGVNVGGMYQPHEYIPFDRANPLEAFLTLSETVGNWKREVGRTVKVQIQPSTLAKKLGSGGSKSRCHHRLWLQGNNTDWSEIKPVPEPGGTFVFIEGVQDEHLVQIQVEDQNATWESPATSQWMQIQLSRGGK